jgi:hypothetical protein
MISNIDKISSVKFASRFVYIQHSKACLKQLHVWNCYNIEKWSESWNKQALA